MAPTIGEHYRHDGETYRVVGAGDPVALLRVTDGGRRASTGDLRRLPAGDVDELDAAPNPDDGVHPLRSLRGMVQGLYWDVRKFLPRGF